MGDRTYTSIEFSGKITQAVAEKLIAELTEQCCCSNKTDDTTLSVDQLDDSFYDSECNYAQMDDVESFCRQHSIPYRKSWEAGGDYGPGMELFTGSETHSCGTLEGEPVVTRKMLVDLGTGILEYFDRFDFSSPRYPPLEIVG